MIDYLITSNYGSQHGSRLCGLAFGERTSQAAEAEKSTLRNCQGFGGLIMCTQPRGQSWWHTLLEQVWAKSLWIDTATQADDSPWSRSCQHRKAVLGEHQGKRADLLLCRYPYGFCYLRRTCLHKSAGKTMFRPIYGHGCATFEVKQKKAAPAINLLEQPLFLLTKFVISFHEALARFTDEPQTQVPFSRCHSLPSS